jgi:hypothetical protein
MMVDALPGRTEAGITGPVRYGRASAAAERAAAWRTVTAISNRLNGIVVFIRTLPRKREDITTVL